MNHLKWMDHSATIFDIQRNLRDDQQSCEVTLVAKGHSVRAHRFVLSSCSDLLRNLLVDIPMGQEATIIVPDIKGSSILESVLAFIYVGETTTTNLSEFLEAINTLGIKSTISFCSSATLSGAVPTTTVPLKSLSNIQIAHEELIEHQENITAEKIETQNVIQYEREMEFLDVYNEAQHSKITYSIEHMPVSATANEYIITENSGVNSFEDVLKTFRNARSFLGEILSSCELVDADSLACSVSHFKLNSPIEGYPFYMLIETSGSNAEHDMEKFNRFLEHGMEKGEILDGTITGEVGKMREIWKLRELVAVALAEDGFCFKYDISLPLREFYHIVDVMKERAGHLANRVCGYGHLGDSNLHLNITCPEFTPEIYKCIEPFVYEFTSQLKGSISAEHGIGFLKRNYLKYSKSPAAIEKMREMKQLLDPNGILNPYKVLN